MGVTRNSSISGSHKWPLCTSSNWAGWRITDLCCYWPKLQWQPPLFSMADPQGCMEGMEGPPSPWFSEFPHPSFLSFKIRKQKIWNSQSNSANSTNYTFRLCPIMWALRGPSTQSQQFHEHSSSLQRKKGLVHSELLPQLPEATSYKYQKATRGMEILNPDGAYS